MRKFHPLLINTHHFWLFAWTYPALWLLQLALGPLLMVGPMFWSTLRVGLLFLFVGFYGIYRVVLFQPLLLTSYQRALALMPWRPGQPLPAGPFYFVWQDVLFIGSCIALALLEGHAEVTASTIVMGMLLCFLVPYVVLNCIPMLRVPWVGVACLFLLPLAVYPCAHLGVTLLVLFVVSVILQVGAVWHLRDFPFNESAWNEPPAQTLLDRARETKTFGYPLKQLGPVGRSLQIQIPVAIMLSLLVTWWVHALTGGMMLWLNGRPSWNSLADGLLFRSVSDSGVQVIWMISWVMAVLWRLYIYLNGYASPLKLRGRIFTLRWLIPSYDKVFIAPVSAVVWGLSGPYWLNVLGLPDQFLLAGSTFVMSVILLGVGPSLEAWRLTGASRVFDPLTIQSNNQNASVSANRDPQITIRIKLD